MLQKKMDWTCPSLGSRKQSREFRLLLALEGINLRIKGKSMEKVIFQSPEDGEAVEFYVIEQTKINGTDYLLVAEEASGDCDAFILKDVSGREEEDAVYEIVESEEELNAVSKLFEEVLEDVDFIM